MDEHNLLDGEKGPTAGAGLLKNKIEEEDSFGEDISDEEGDKEKVDQEDKKEDAEEIKVDKKESVEEVKDKLADSEQ